MHVLKNKPSFSSLPRFLLVATVFSTAMLGLQNLSLAQTATSTPAKMAMPSTDAKQPMEMQKSMEDMHQKMTSMTKSGNPDVDFAMMMRIHHQGAIDMAQIEVDKGKDPEMIRSAKKIIAAQKKELAEFDRWLAKHKQ